MDQHFEITVVMPIYNVEKFLREAIDSVIGQTIGFEENIQLILVNDGSPDNSESICLEYRDKYPNNVIYISQKNAGVSAARNAGIKYIRGELVNFMDSDDKWDTEAFLKFYNFFKENNNVEVAVANMIFFDKRKGAHPLNSRGEKGERIADINNKEEYNSIVLHVTSTFFRTNAIGNVRFKEGLKYGEDSLFVNTIILQQQLIGILPEAICYYRRRYDDSSAVQQSKRDPQYYLDTLDSFLLELINISKKKYQKVIPYIQNVIYYDLTWRLRTDISSVLDSKQKEIFLGKVHILLQDVDDYIILHSRVNVNFVYKDYAWKLKYGHALSEDIKITKDGILCVNGSNFMNMSSNSSCKIVFAEIEKGCFIVEGTISKWIFDCAGLSPCFVLNVGRKKFLPELNENFNNYVITIDGKEYYQYNFRFCIPLEDLGIDKSVIRIKIGFLFKNKFYNICLNYSKFVPNWNSSKWIRKTSEEGYTCNFQRMLIEVWLPRHPALSLAKSEFNHQKWMRQNGLHRIANFRICYILHKIFHHSSKEIWLISDRINKADDNGEALFEYLNSINIPNVRPIYVISKDADRISDLKSKGEIVFYESRKYKKIFLDATKIISSSADEGGFNPLNPFEKNRIHLQDFFHQKFYFLQHGVTENDLSSWLNRYNKNITIFYTSSSREYNSIINGSYGYTEKNVALTGLARFDRLEDRREKNILIIPTWRRSISLESEGKTENGYYERFRETEFFRFFNTLINHPRLLRKMREKGYTGTFALHPKFVEQWVDFQENDVFTVTQGYLNYSDAFSKASLVLTDYSGNAFDLAYLRKYIVYAQFDKEKFYEGQIYDAGYFDFEEDGFGPVCYDIEGTVDALIKALDNDCVVSQKYLDRMNSFFAFNDQNNCERIYNTIIESDNIPFKLPELSFECFPNSGGEKSYNLAVLLA